jgi:hypothetical protein
MARFICMVTALALGSAIVSRPAAAQQGSSVSLTHTVTVTVPPRVKVQVSNAAPVQSATRVSSSQATDGLALSVNATQPWTLSIGSAAQSSKVQWSLDQISGFANVTARNATVASGALSQTPATATVFFRNATKVATSGGEDSDGSNAVMLTVVAP